MIGKYVIAAALVLPAAIGHAGGIERSHSPYAILWEKGNYAELSFGHVSPEVSGSVATLGSGNILKNYTQASLGVKYAFSPNLDVAVVIDQPVGANIAYPAGTGYPIAGSNARIRSDAITALLRYRFDQNWSVHGGLKVQRTKGNVQIRHPVFVNYQMETSSETDAGFLLGGAYERPEIALRVALTYQSAITHDFTAREQFPVGGIQTTSFKNKAPQSLTLDFQTGVAPDTLLFGSVRWREWSAFNITPPLYQSQTIGSTDPQNPNASLVAYGRNVVTLNLGLGRKFTENFSGSISVGYEKSNGLRTSNLGPHDGLKSVTLAGVYTQDNWKITGGVTYARIGDATTYAPLFGNFKDNKTVGVGLKIGYSF